MVKTLRQKLKSVLPGEVSTAPKILKRYSRDASLFTIKPKAVVWPKDSADLARLITYAAGKTAPGISLTARSGGTDMTGGALSDSVIVDLSRHFNKIISVGEAAATVQPGVFYKDFEAATLKQGLLLPSYPASREICTVGGMVANNSGGEKTLAYGKTERYVKKLKVMLRDGKEYEMTKLNQAQLKQKLAPRTLEAGIYRKLVKLITENHRLIQAAKPNVSKNSTGYNLWSVYDKEQGTFDASQLFVGSQGTLGIITEITFRLITPPPHSQLLIIFLPDLRQLADIVQRTLAYRPTSFESFDDHTFKLAMRFLPDLIKQMKVKNSLRLVWQFLPELTTMLTGGTPKLLLLAEFTGETQHEVTLRAEAAAAALTPFNVKTHLTASPTEARKYWVMRRESFNILRHHVHGKRTAPFIDDIIVRPDQLPEFLPELEKIVGRYNITYTIAGHIGDANFHIIPLMDMSRADTDDIIEELGAKVYDLVFRYGGSMSAEHNDGLIRSHYLEKMYGPEIYRLFGQVKEIFDPTGIFNPGKKTGSNWEYAKKHLVKN
jgi:FAD/FMN-containing dehydrogenase